MSKYPKINYIGNKAKLVDWIIENLPLKRGKVLDIFSGGSSVSYALKENNYEVISNDVLYSNYVISKAIIENSSLKLNNEIRNKIQDNTVKRHDKAIERFIELSKIIGKVQDKKEYEKCKRRKEAKYIYDGEGLIKLLLDINSNNIKTKIKRTKLSPSSFL